MIMIIRYTVPEIWCVTDAIAIFYFGLFFSLLRPPSTPSIPKNTNFKTMKQMPAGIIILLKCTKTHDHMLY